MIWSAFSARGVAAVAAMAFTVSTAVVPSTGTQAESKRPARAWSVDESYILLKGGNGSMTMRGSTTDVREARHLRKADEPLFYFRRGGRSYLVRDAAVLRQAQAIVKPQEELGARQGELGSRQGALGAKQAALGQRQAALSVRYRSGRRPDEAAREQAVLAGQQAELGRQQAKLGEEQTRLGREQARLAREAEMMLGALADDAIRGGLAREVD